MGASGNPLMNLMPVVLIFIVFYFLLIRPQQKKQKEHEATLAGLQKNDEIVTTGGINGTIINVKETSVILRIDDNVKVELQKNCVAYVKKSRSDQAA